MIRQGDILFIPVSESIPDHSKRLETRVIAEGEATGHHHQIAECDTENAELYSCGWRGDMMLRVAGDSISIVHEEHKTVTIPAGNYKIHQAREFDYLSLVSRPVRD